VNSTWQSYQTISEKKKKRKNETLEKLAADLAKKNTSKP